MGIVAILCFILHGGGVDGDTTCALLRGGVDFVVLFGGGVSEGGQSHSQRRRKSGFAMVNMPNCADVDVGFLPLELTPSGANDEAPTWCGGGGRGRGGGAGVERGGQARGKCDV